MNRNRLKKYFLVLISFHLSICVRHADSFYTQRQRYASRMLKITPKECTSSSHPDIVGICMISLECQQRSGTVIGACRDGHLFGACCHDPLAASPTTGTSSQTTEKSSTTTSTEKTTTTTEVPSSEKSIENNEITAPAAPFDDNSDSTQIPSLIDTFSELSPTFLSELALDEHTTGMYGMKDEILLSDDSDDRSSAPVEPFKFKTPRSTVFPPEPEPSHAPTVSSERPTDASSSAPTEEEEVGGLNTFGPDPEFKDNMIKYIDEIVTMRNNELTPVEEEIPPLQNNEVNIEDIPFSTFTIISSTKPSEDPIVYSWTTSGTSNVDVTTPTPLIPSTTTNPTPFSTTIRNKNASEEILSMSIAQTVGPLLSSSSTEGSNDLTTTHITSTEASGPTKFTFSKLKYTPRPFRPRQTTRRMIWTRPTTEAPEPFWIKPVDITGDDADEDEEEQEEQEQENHISSTTHSTTIPSSTEHSTTLMLSSSTEGTSSSAPVEDIAEDLPYSSEAPIENYGEFEHDNDDHQEQTTVDYPYASSSPPQTTGYGYDWSTPTIMSYLKGTSESFERLYYGVGNLTASRKDYESEGEVGVTGTENEISSTSAADGTNEDETEANTTPLSWRTSTPRIEDSTERTSPPEAGPSSPTSSSWDASIDSFVDQVVDGLVQDLNKSNKIDDMIFNNNNKNKSSKKDGGERRSGNPNVFSTTPAAVKFTSLKNKLKSSLEKAKIKSTSSRPTVSTTSASSESPIKSTTSKEKLKKVKAKVKIPTGTNKRRQNKDKNKPVKKVTTIKTANSTRKRLDYKKDCGVRPLIKRGRIVGGTPSQFGSWPWHALVKETVWWGIFSKIKCGGVLIGAQHVLTAAHCQPQQTGTLSVVLGITDSDDTADSRAITKTVKRIIPHPQFNPRTYENDIAILELDTPIDFQPHIVPICLPREDDALEGKTAYVTGMGLLKHDGERPLVLQEVDLPIMNNTECQKMFVRSGNMKPIIDSFICAGYEQGRKDSCGGDSGGPLSVKRPNGQWVLAGTVSHGIKCGYPNLPGVYMRTRYYMPWLHRVLNMARTKYRGIPRCNAPPLICARQRYHQENQPRNDNGFVSTLFRIFRLARKMVEEGRKST